MCMKFSFNSIAAAPSYVRYNEMKSLLSMAGEKTIDSLAKNEHEEGKNVTPANNETLITSS